MKRYCATFGCWRLVFWALKSQTFSSLLRKVESFFEKSQNGNITHHWKSQIKRVPVAFPKLRLKKADAVSRAGILLFQAVQSVDDCDETEKTRNLHVSKIWPRAVISDHFVQWEILIQFHFSDDLPTNEYWSTSRYFLKMNFLFSAVACHFSPVTFACGRADLFWGWSRWSSRWRRDFGWGPGAGRGRRHRAPGRATWMTAPWAAEGCPPVETLPTATAQPQLKK